MEGYADANFHIKMKRIDLLAHEMFEIGKMKFDVRLSQVYLQQCTRLSN